jgi:peptidoglycan/LPS O-acetylase OafA/YrhL
MAGCGLALVASTGRALAPSRALVVVGALVIGVAAATQQIGGVPLQAAGGVPLTLAGTLVLIAAVRAGRAGWLSFRPLAKLGVISYSMYLWHMPILLAVWATFGQQIAPTFLALVVAVTVASTSHRLANPIRLWARDARRTAAPSIPDVTLINMAVVTSPAQSWGGDREPGAIPIATTGAT